MTPFQPESDPKFARQRLAAVAATASLLAHSGRNRLAVVRAALELLQARMEKDLTDAQRTAFLAQLDLFLGDFNLGLDMVRCHEGRIETVSLREIAVEALEVVRAPAKTAGIDLRTEFADGADEARGDRGLLRMTLLNLLRNAIEALGKTPQPAILLRVRGDGPRLVLEVEDNGPGVPPYLRDRIFREFCSDRHGATGLGLSLCRDALITMGGAISHQPGPSGTGAVFRLELPRS